MRVSVATIVLLPLLMACGGNARTPDEGAGRTEWNVDGVESSRLLIAGHEPFETGLHVLHYIGQVRGAAQVPWLVMSGRYCDECDALIALYVHSPSAGPMRLENGEGALQHPGRLMDGETGEVYHTTRTFYGEVLPGVRGVISYENLLDAGAEGEWYTNLIDLSGAARRDTQYMDTSRLPQTLELATKGKCQEIPGIDQLSAP